MAKEAGRRIGPMALRLWPTSSNPAWNFPGTADIVLGPALAIRIDPARIGLKLAPEGQRAVRGRFLVDDFSAYRLDRISDLYTYQDMQEIVLHGDDYRATHLYRWLKAGLDAKRPVHGRGQVFDSDAKIEAYYRVYLDMVRSMRQDGYRHEETDGICVGLRRDASVVLVRRGTHRIAAAQILGLPWIEACITHVEIGFFQASQGRFAGNAIEALKTAIHEAIG
jgi:hypothetical protein